MHGFFLFDSVGETAWPLCFDHRGSSSLTFPRLTAGDCQASCMLLLARRFPGVLGLVLDACVAASNSTYTDIGCSLRGPGHLLHDACMAR